MTRTIDDVLAAARARLDRPDPQRTAALVADGAILVDTRPDWQREQEGELDGALLIERNHIEWRLDPTSAARIPQAVDHDVTWIVVCSEGYSSSLAGVAAGPGSAQRHRPRRRLPGVEARLRHPCAERGALTSFSAHEAVRRTPRCR